MVQSKDVKKRDLAVSELSFNFSVFPDKDQFWQDINQLAMDESSDVRWKTAFALGNILTQFPFNEKAFQILYNLTMDVNSNVRGHAIFILGSKFNLLDKKEKALEIIIHLTSVKSNL